MKKFLLMMALCLMALGAQAQSKKFCGTITFRDGHEETYTELYVPARNTDKLLVRPDGGKMKKIPSEDIQMVTVWSAKFPDMKSTIFCLPIEEKGKRYVLNLMIDNSVYIKPLSFVTEDWTVEEIDLNL